jgi:hypothetical protein
MQCCFHRRNQHCIVWNNSLALQLTLLTAIDLSNISVWTICFLWTRLPLLFVWNHFDWHGWVIGKAIVPYNAMLVSLPKPTLHCMEQFPCPTTYPTDTSHWSEQYPCERFAFFDKTTLTLCVESHWLAWVGYRQGDCSIQCNVGTKPTLYCMEQSLCL